MHELLEKILETTILLILWYNGTPESTKSQGSSTNSTARPSVANQLISVIIDFLNKNKITHSTDNTPEESRSLFESRSSHLRSYYSNVPAAPFIPAFDPISVLASLAFLAFLLQSFAALFDRTRSMIPTIVSSRELAADYNQQFVEIENRVMRAIEEYANFSTNLLENQNKKKNPKKLILTENKL